jgi:eukaryotic-like serine/threonine-protein kinase
MGFMVHRGQALLLLVVGGLAAAVVGIVALSGTAVPATVAVRVGGVVDARDSGLPARIEVGGPVRQAASPGAGTAVGDPAGPTSAAGAPRPAGSRAAGATTVGTSSVYTYPPDDHGHGGTSGDGGSSGGTSGDGGSSDGGSGGHRG